MSFRDKFIPTNCYVRSACKQEADKAAFRSLFDREWEVFVIKRDPATGKFKGETLCCESPVPKYEAKLNAPACC